VVDAVQAGTGREEGEAARVQRVAAFIAERAAGARVAIILGSGLGALADAIEDAVPVPYEACAALPKVTVTGHAGTMVFGRLEGSPCIVMQGRYHLYEGHDAATVSLPVRALLQAGVSTLILTNSAGGLNRTFRPGDLMLIDDHINLLATNPLAGEVLSGEERFPDMSSPWDARLLAAAEAVARRERIRVVRGVYCAVRGPSYETPAEIRMLSRMGADAVGMSTVPELLAARAGGARVLGISVITNVAAGITPHAVSHDEVMAAGRAAASSLTRLVRGVIAQLHA
jgi:purine-nucleoside phosphorylase